MSDLRRDFASREELVEYLRSEFPQAAERDDTVSPIRGGRRAAENALARVEPARYSATRNQWSGAVTRLSMYIRHGVLGLAEVRDDVLRRVRSWREAEKLINELGWRDYWQRVYRSIGDGIWRDREPYKTGYTAADYSTGLPADIRRGETGLVCIDAFRNELHTVGYLHNHGRMWLAAYVVHWRRVRWQVGAAWFLEHLLDGDPASNNLSWQWVASTFSHKPYYFNRETLERFTAGVFCRTCPLYGHCAFEGDYEALADRLFPNVPPRARSEW